MANEGVFCLLCLSTISFRVDVRYLSAGFILKKRGDRLFPSVVPFTHLSQACEMCSRPHGVDRTSVPADSASAQVLGDDGRLYVPAENVDIYRDEVLPLATMITPNQFEAELLSGVMIATEEDAVRACMALHSRCVGGLVVEHPCGS